MTKPLPTETPSGRIASPKHPGPLALSVKQPWAWAIVHAGKRIENRSWATSYRGVIYVHASAQFSRTDYQRARDWMLERRLIRPRRIPDYDQLERGVFVGRTHIIDTSATIDARLRPWETHDGYAWHLSDVVAVPHIACRGTHKLWIPPDDVLAQLEAS